MISFIEKWKRADEVEKIDFFARPKSLCGNSKSETSAAEAALTLPA